MGSGKALRVFVDANVEKVVCVYGTRAAVVVLNVSDGSLVKKKVLADSLGQMSDVEVLMDDGKENLKGFALAGHSYNDLKAGTSGCTSKCTDIRGEIHILDENLTLSKSGSWDGFKGGLYQYSGISVGNKALLHTECWGIAKSYNKNGSHDGFIVGCGNGIEGCPSRGYTASAKKWCQNDPRNSWRALLVKTNLEGKVDWYRQDNFWDGKENPGTSASEYVMSNNRTIVSVNDELLGVGLEIL